MERKVRGEYEDVLLTSLDMILDLTESSTKLAGTVNYKYGVVTDRVVTGMINEIYDILERVGAAADEPIERFRSVNASAMAET
jgi:hypothetical protein